MSGPAGHRSAMSRAFGPTNLDPDEMVILRRAAWRSHGIAILRPEEVHNEQARRTLIEQANRLYGRRSGAPGSSSPKGDSPAGRSR